MPEASRCSSGCLRDPWPWPLGFGFTSYFKKVGYFTSNETSKKKHVFLKNGQVFHLSEFFEMVCPIYFEIGLKKKVKLAWVLQLSLVGALHASQTWPGFGNRHRAKASQDLLVWPS